MNRHHSSGKPCFMGFSEDASVYCLQIGYTCHLATIRDGCSVNDIFKLLRHLGLFIRIQMTVSV